MPFDDPDLMELKQLRDQLREISHTLDKIHFDIRIAGGAIFLGVGIYFILTVWEWFSKNFIQTISS